MRHIFEEYGDVIMQIIGGAGVLALLVDLIRPEGTLHAIIVRILESAV